MNKFHRPLLAATLTALGLSLAHAGAFAGAESSGLTRAEVREDLKDARATNTMTPSGEIGDTAEVLAARETFNALQTEVMLARNQQAQQVASTNLGLDELVAELQAIDAEDGAIVALTAED